jgi:hypothetical protein
MRVGVPAIPGVKTPGYFQASYGRAASDILMQRFSIFTSKPLPKKLKYNIPDESRNQRNSKIPQRKNILDRPSQPPPRSRP